MKKPTEKQTGQMLDFARKAVKLEIESLELRILRLEAFGALPDGMFSPALNARLLRARLDDLRALLKLLNENADFLWQFQMQKGLERALESMKEELKRGKN